MFSLIPILRALIHFITGVSCGIIINCVLDFSQSLLHSNRQRTNTQEVFCLASTSNLTTYRLMPLELGPDPNQHWYFFEKKRIQTYLSLLPVDVRSPNWTIESDNNQDWLHSRKTVPTPITSLPWGRTPIQWIHYIDEISRAFCISYRRYSTLSRISRTRFSWSGLDSSQFTPNWPSGESIFLHNPDWVFNINPR